MQAFPTTGFLLADIAVGNWSSLGLGTLCHLLVAVLVTLHCLREPREPRSALFWIYLAWALPVVGALLYLAFGINRLPAKGWQKQRSDQAFWEMRRSREEDSQPLAYWHGLQEGLLVTPHDPADARLQQIFDRLYPTHPLLGGNDITDYTDGEEAYPPMLEAIRNARHHIHLQSYIVGADDVGREFFDLMADKAREGVRVRVLYDGFGSAEAHLRGFFRGYARVPNMEVVGFAQVNPIKRHFQVNLRNHRKILVVDGERGFIGGMNICKENCGRLRRQAENRDYHFAVGGPILLELQYTFLRDWYYMTHEAPDVLLSQNHFPPITPKADVAMRIVNAGPTSEREALCDANFALIGSATSQILLGTPYFVPPDDMRRALRMAAMRGVDVRLLVPGKTNHLSTTYAARSTYEEMLRAGVRLFLRHPPFMHGKFLIVDGRNVMLGTANFDNRSLKLNYETNLIVFDTAFANSFKRRVLADYAHAEELSLASWRRRPFKHRLVENLFNLASPAL